MTRVILTAAALLVCGPAPAQRPPVARGAAPAGLQFEDQFGRKAELSSLKGHVAVLVYGDRKGTDECRAYGEQLHTLFHPSAQGQPPAKARTAAVAPLPGLPAGRPSPDVVVVPVACAGKVPGVVRDMISSSVKKASPDVPVWLDFTGAMQDGYGLEPGQVNLAVFDAAGRSRLVLKGAPSAADGQKLVQLIQNLRAEAAGVGK